MQGCAEHRRAGRLNREVESVLQQPRRQHVAHQLRRHRGDAHLGVVEHLPVFADHRAGLHHQLNQLTLLLGEVGVPLRWGGDGGWLIRGDGGQHLGADARQVHLLPAEVLQLFRRAAHRAHNRVHLGRTDRDIHHHLRVEHIGGGIGGCSAINRHLHHTHRHIFEFKASLRIGEHRPVFQAKNEHLHARQGLQEDIIRGVGRPIRTRAEVVVAHRFEIRAGAHHLAHQGGARHRREIHRGEGTVPAASGCAIAIGIQQLAISGGANLAAVQLQIDASAPRQGLVEKQPGTVPLRCHHDGGRQTVSGRVRGPEAVARDGGWIHRPAETHLGAEGGSYLASAVGGAHRFDRQRNGFWQAQRERGGRAQPRPVLRRDRKGLVAGWQAPQAQWHIKGPGGAVKHQRSRHALVEAVAQRLHRSSRSVHAADQAGPRLQQSAVTEAGDCQDGGGVVELEAVFQ